MIDVIDPTYMEAQTVHLFRVIVMQHMCCKRKVLIAYKRVNKNIIKKYVHAKIGGEG